MTGYQPIRDQYFLILSVPDVSPYHILRVSWANEGSSRLTPPSTPTTPEEHIPPFHLPDVPLTPPFYPIETTNPLTPPYYPTDTLPGTPFYSAEVTTPVTPPFDTTEAKPLLPVTLPNFFPTPFNLDVNPPPPSYPPTPPVTPDSYTSYPYQTYLQPYQPVCYPDPGYQYPAYSNYTPSYPTDPPSCDAYQYTDPQPPSPKSSPVIRSRKRTQRRTPYSPPSSLLEEAAASILSEPKKKTVRPRKDFTDSQRSTLEEPTETSKQPIKTRYLCHMTGYQPIRDQFFMTRSVPTLPTEATTPEDIPPFHLPDVPLTPPFYPAETTPLTPPFYPTEGAVPVTPPNFFPTSFNLETNSPPPSYPSTPPVTPDSFTSYPYQTYLQPYQPVCYPDPTQYPVYTPTYPNFTPSYPTPLSSDAYQYNTDPQPPSPKSSPGGPPSSSWLGLVARAVEEETSPTEEGFH
eukprot:sb/3464509/